MSWFSITKGYLAFRFRCISCGQLRHASWTSQGVRSTFVEYFKDQGHTYVPSSSVIPKKGEGTYFTNAGMNQFKPIFLGELDPTSKFQNLVRATNSQKCIRVGGKHNDLDDVGLDLTHHTFFEMLGNWSFSDYFKVEACGMAYDLLTKQYKLPVERLYFTYFAGDESLELPMDEECKQVWLSLGIPEDRVLPFGVKDNFWDMGLTGPCGPCTEIHYDHLGSRQAGSEVNTGSPCVVEIWNLVFLQYNRQADQSLQLLPKFHVDTGMGLERMTAVLTGTADNYTTDLFLPMLQLIEKEAVCPPYRGNSEEINKGYRMLADHARMFTVAIGDGLLPRHDNLGHKLRTILHRCIHICRDIFHVKPEIMLPNLVSQVVESLGSTYPELSHNEQRIIDVVKATIDYHDKNREQVVKIFNKMLSKSMKHKELSGEMILALEKGFYGSPMSIETIQEQASVHQLTLDLAGYERLLEERKAQVSSAPLTAAPDRASVLVNEMAAQQMPVTEDGFKYHYYCLGDGTYDFSLMTQEASPSLIQGLSSQGQVTDVLWQGEEGEIILDRTCFYAESGGQEADCGVLVSETGKFLVTDVQCRRGYVIHYGQVTTGSLSHGQSVEPVIYQASREGCMRNHTATHLLNSSLTEVLPSTQQQGSSVTPYRFSFDFLALTSIETNHIQQVETEVRKAIKREFPVSRKVMPLADALKLKEVKTLQNEEYPDEVSVIAIGSEDGSLSVSTELCGGTHVLDTSHLGEFCITHMTTKSQSVKRMTCVTGPEAEQAHLNGRLVQCICLVLQSLVESYKVTDERMQQLSSLMQKVVSYIDARQERLEHSLTYQADSQAESSTRLKELMEENDKAKTLWQTVSSSIEQLVKGSSEPEDIMKQLVTYIRKGSQLELLPKTVRDEANNCLESFEHKVAEAVNKRDIRLLQELIQKQTKTSSDRSPVVLEVDHIDTTPRQIAKVLLQPNWDRQLIVIQKSQKTISIVVSRPLSSAEPFSKEQLDKIINQLNTLGKAKGKLTSQKKNVAVYTFTIQGDLDSTDVMQILKSQDVFQR